jgi:hypothetical protein
VGCVLGFFVASKTLTVHGPAKPGQGFVAIPRQVGGQDIFGAHDVAKGWPKDVSTLPGNEKWTWGAGQGNELRLSLVYPNAGVALSPAALAS